MKKQITLRIDEDILDWFRGRGRGYQSHINKALCFYVDNFKRTPKMDEKSRVASRMLDVIAKKKPSDQFFNPQPKKGKK